MRRNFRLDDHYLTSVSDDRNGSCTGRFGRSSTKRRTCGTTYEHKNKNEIPRAGIRIGTKNSHCSLARSCKRNPSPPQESSMFASRVGYAIRNARSDITVRVDAYAAFEVITSLALSGLYYSRYGTSLQMIASRRDSSSGVRDAEHRQCRMHLID